MFIKYPHIERLGSDEVEGIFDGACYLFPKIDGTNSSVWLENEEIKAGSRNRELSLDNDNQGFYAHVLDGTETAKLQDFFAENPNLTLYMEWLVPHTLKTYRKDAWNRFYIFDVYDRQAAQFISYENYAPLLDDFGLTYIPPLVVFQSPPTAEAIMPWLDKNTYLIADGQGVGEGIVIKRYGFVNKYGRTTWAKVVRNEFKEQNHMAFGVPTVETKNLEYEIVREFLTRPMVEKVKANLEPWQSNKIPQLLGTVWHDFVTEELWSILKKHKNPTLDFKALNRYVIERIKELMPEVF